LADVCQVKMAELKKNELDKLSFLLLMNEFWMRE